MHCRLDASPEGDAVELGGERWRPHENAQWLAHSLSHFLGDERVLDLVLFGSQARGGTTGFSDVDAILVITDNAAETPRALRGLRRNVLAAQRAVLAYQPMQHHGFEVATPKLLAVAGDALALPAAALDTTRSLRGRAMAARFGPNDGLGRPEGLRTLAETLAGVQEWPGHPWRLHRIVSMFELLPTLYLQSQGRSVPKWRSFELAEAEFRSEWWPYEVLRDVRVAWPSNSALALRTSASILRNPWLAVALWTRMPAPPPREVAGLLTRDCLQGLRLVASRMLERVSRPVTSS